MFNFIKKLFRRKNVNNVDCVVLTLYEIEKLAQCAGFKISEYPSNYEDIKDNFDNAFRIYEDDVDGFSFEDEEYGDSLYRTIGVRNNDTEFDCIYIISEDLLEEDE